MTGGSWRPAAERRSTEAVCAVHDYMPRTLVTGGRRDNAGRRGQSLVYLLHAVYSQTLFTC